MLPTAGLTRYFSSTVSYSLPQEFITAQFEVKAFSSRQYYYKSDVGASQISLLLWYVSSLGYVNKRPDLVVNHY